MESELKTVVLVDDIPANLRAGKNVLAGKYEIFTAPSAKKLLELLETVTPSLILLDIEMPEMSGYDAIKMLKSDPKTRDIPVIFLTGKTDADNELEGLSLGAIDYITKPFIPLLLLKRIEVHLLVEAQRRALHEISHRYLSPEIVEHLLESPKGLDLGGHKKNISILMSDIRGFTPITEQMSAEEAVTMLNYYFRIMGKVIRKYEGTVIEFIGDAILVAFGAIKDIPNHADNAVACALEMQTAMMDVNEWNEYNGFPKLEIGIGVNTGDTIVGNIGNTQKMSFNLIGSSVNLASRIESLTTGGQVLISDNTYRSVSTDLSLLHTTQVHPKGSSPVSVHAIDGIGNPYNLSIKFASSPLVEISTPLSVDCYKIHDKEIAQTVYPCVITAVSDKEAVLKGNVVLEIFDNIKLNLSDGTEAFAKVVAMQTGSVTIRWTFGAEKVFKLAKRAKSR
jgi:class 3 adenylate cyclase